MAERILIVDDEPTTRLLVRRILEQHGLGADIVASGREALSFLAENNYDLVIVDLYMPEMDGFAILEWLKLHQSHIVSLILSATTRFEDVVNAMQHGAFDFVMKPIKAPKVFIEQVRRALAHKGLQDDNEALLNTVQSKNAELENRLSQLKLAHRVLQSQSMAIQADLNRARTIQRGLLPRSFPFWQEASLSVLYHPANKVGGDFYDVFKLDDTHLGLYIADAAGHGVSSALITVFLKDSVHPLKNGACQGDYLKPGELLRSLNEMIHEAPFREGLFVSMTYMIIDMQKRTMSYANAGHPPLLLRHEDGKISQLRSPAPALGINHDVKYSTEEYVFADNDVIVMHTDGVTDVQNIDHVFYGRERFISLIENAEGNSLGIAHTIEADLNRFSGPIPFNDDTTVLVLDFHKQPDETISFLPEEICMESEPVLEEATGMSAATENGCAFVKVTGSGTWKESKVLNDLCASAEQNGVHRIIVDLAHCVHLDSTFMGTLHSMCAKVEERPNCDIQLQRIPKTILKLFSELGLTQVLMHFRSKPKSLPPAMDPLNQPEMADADMGRLLISAHEALVKADPQNADRFSAVLKVLHQQAAHKIASEEEEA